MRTSPLFDADEVGHVRPPHAGPVVVVLSRSSLNFLTLVALLYFSHVPALISAHVLSRYVPFAKRCTYCHIQYTLPTTIWHRQLLLPLLRSSR